MTPSLRARLPSTATRCCGALDAMHEILQFERVIQGERIPILLPLDLTLSPKIIVHCDRRVSDNVRRVFGETTVLERQGETSCTNFVDFKTSERQQWSLLPFLDDVLILRDRVSYSAMNCSISAWWINAWSIHIYFSVSSIRFFRMQTELHCFGVAKIFAAQIQAVMTM